MASDILVRVGADITDLSRGMAESQRKIQGLTKTLGNVQGNLSKVGTSLTNKITKPAIGAAAALTGITVVKGFQRLVGIDTARAKLKALGHDAGNIENIMDSAMESVKGTSYGFGEAATIAASAVAAGVEPGKELTRYLTLAGDAAAVAGIGLNEMGDIFNKVKTANKAYNGELQQLSSRGLPVYQWLEEDAKKAGKSVTDMAADGEISSKMLLDAVEKNIGGASGIIGAESFMAGVANVGAAIGRIGASFLDAGGEAGGFFSKLKPLMADFIGYIDGLGGVAEQAGAKFGNAFTTIIDKAKEVKAWYDDLSPAMQDFTKNATLIGSAVAVGIGPALKVIGTLVGVISKVAGGIQALGPLFTFLTGPIGLTIAAVIAIGAALVIAYKKVEWFRDMVDAAWAWIKDAFFTAISWIKDNVVVPIMTEVASFISEILEKIKEYWDKYGDLILSTAKLYFDSIWQYIKAVMGVIKGIFEIIWPIISGIVKIAWGLIKNIVRNTLDVITGIIDTVMALIQGDWEGAWESIKETLVNIWNNMKKFLEEVDLVQIGKNIIQGLINGIGSMAGAVWDSVTKIGENIKSAFTGFFSIHSPSRLMASLSKHIPGGAIVGIESMIGKVRRTTDKLSEAMTPETRDISMDYSTPSGSYASLASAISGTVDVDSRDDMIAGAIDNLNRKLDSLRIEMNEKEMARFVSDSAQDSRNKAVRGRGNRRL